MNKFLEKVHPLVFSVIVILGAGLISIIINVMVGSSSEEYEISTTIRFNNSGCGIVDKENPCFNQEAVFAANVSYVLVISKDKDGLIALLDYSAQRTSKARHKSIASSRKVISGTILSNEDFGYKKKVNDKFLRYFLSEKEATDAMGEDGFVSILIPHSFLETGKYYVGVVPFSSFREPEKSNIVSFQVEDKRMLYLKDQYREFIEIITQ